MGLRINVLGPLEVKGDHGDLRIGPRKARALLAYLAMHREQSVGRERLADLLWPCDASEQSRHSLRNCLSEIRRAFGGAANLHLVIDQTNCRLPDVEVDLALCERAFRAGDEFEMQTAAELYRGELLADLFIGSEPFQEWLAAERERALNLVCGILERLADRQIAAGDDLGAIGSARRLVALDRLSEAGHRALMRAYAKAGRRAEALRHYKRCSEILKREIGVAPDAETDALAREIGRTNTAGPVGLVQRSYETALDRRAAQLPGTHARDSATWSPPWLLRS